MLSPWCVKKRRTITDAHGQKYMDTRQCTKTKDDQPNDEMFHVASS